MLKKQGTPPQHICVPSILSVTSGKSEVPCFLNIAQNERLRSTEEILICGEVGIGFFSMSGEAANGEK